MPSSSSERCCSRKDLTASYCQRGPYFASISRSTKGLSGAPLFVSPPANRMDRPAHRSSAYLHTMFSFPPLAIVLLARPRVGFQQLLHSHSQGRSFLRRPPWNGARQNGSCFASLLHIPLDGRPRHLEEIHDLHSGDPFVNGAKHLLFQILWIGSHASILSPGSRFLQALVHKLPLGGLLLRLLILSASDE